MVAQSAIFNTSIGVISIEYIDSRLTLLQIMRGEPILGIKVMEEAELEGFALDVYNQVGEYLRGERWEFDLELDYDWCTDFQRRVYQEMLKVSYGEVVSYGELAERVGCVGGARAVGMAANRNRWHLLVPCHRVVGCRGSLTGYAAGLDVKAKLLSMEQR